MGLLDEQACASLIEATDDENKPKIYRFIARLNDRNKWEVELSLPKNMSRKLHARRGEVREFARLNGVEKFMKKIGAKEFTVIMGNR
jgi:hypothetical protein